MSKRIGIVFLCIVLVCSVLAVPAMAAGSDPIEIYVDGTPVGEAGDAILIDGVAYVPLRTVCDYYGGVTTWDASTHNARVVLEGTAIDITLWSRFMTANGRILYDSSVSVILDGALMIPARQLAKALNATVSWDGANSAIRFTSGTSPIESADTYYDSDDLYWMSRIIQAEAGGESFDGKVAVGNVVMNRVASASFSDTVYGVIFQRGQFSPASNGAIYRDPSAESILAAKVALEGEYNVAGSALYFQNVSITGRNWMTNNLVTVVKLGNHTFYA